MESVLFQVVVILMVAAVAGAIATLLRQPLIIAFIVVGVLLGPFGLGVVEESGEIELLAQIGITLLLFIVGLKLDLGNIRMMGPVALAAGIGQMVFTTLFGFLLGLVLGLPAIASVYVAVALAMSSAVIPMKVLTDKREVDSLHGRITIGALIVQDIGVIGAIVALTAFGAVGKGELSLSAQLGVVALHAAGLVLGTAILTRWLIPPLLELLTRSQELLALFSVAWAVSVAFAANELGLSREFGAFLAGVALASTPYREAIGARLSGLRDFLLLFFFIGLGISLDPAILRAQVSHSAAFSAFVLIGNTLIVMVIMGLMGYRSRTSFFTGTALAQTSVFSLVVASMGLALGHITTGTLGLITLSGITTIAVCTYVLTYSAPIYKRLRPVLGIFERKRPLRELADDALPDDAQVDAVVLGLGRFGSGVARGLQMRQRRVLGVDFDPDTLARARHHGLAVIYGDVSDPEFLSDLPLDKTAIVVCTVPGLEINLTVLRLLDQSRYQGRVAVMAQNETEATSLRTASADLVLEPYIYAAEHAAEAVIAATHHLPQRHDLPLDVAEVALPAGSALAGRSLREVPVRAETGASVIAVSRAGNVLFDPEPDLQLFPGDYLILMGCPDDLIQARELLQHRAFEGQPEVADFVIQEVLLADTSPLVGRSLAESDFRNRFGATVIGAQRGDGGFFTPDPRELLRAGDRLFLAGPRETVAGMTL